MFGGFNATKLKAQLKMAVGRIQIASNKKAALLKQNMREVAVLLADDPPKEEKAKIRAEALIRDDNVIEAYEILQLECELLHERIKLIEYSKACPADLVSVISTLIWASHRVDVPELQLIRQQFQYKYGKEFVENAMRNYDGCLNERVVAKLSVEPPAAYLVQRYLERICEQFDVEWTPSMKLTADQMIQPMAAPVGYSVPVAQGTGLGPKIIVGGHPIHPSDNNTENSSIPPTLPMAPTFSTTTTQTNNLPKPSSQPPPPPVPPPATTKNTNDFFDEPDIFVPGGNPPAPNGTVASRKDQENKDDDEDSKPGNPAGTSSGGEGDLSNSYANLAARFEQLKK